VAVPVSLIGTFAGMQALGFSINTLTLFGMILAIGLVVDDAIIVVENVERHMKEECCSAKDAAKRAMAEVTGPVIAIVLVLCAVFVPVGFLGGITGQLYKQFAITIAMSVTISGFVALTLSPALCALVLKPGGEGERKGFFALFNRTFAWTQGRYSATVGGVLKRSGLVLAVFGVLMVIMVGLFRVIPSSFLPDEDQGYFIAMFQLPDGASKQRTDVVLSKIEQYFLSNPAIHSTDAMSGLNFIFNTRGPNSATMFVPLHLWDKRKENLQRSPRRSSWPSTLLPSEGSAPPGDFPCNYRTPAGETSRSFQPSSRSSSPRSGRIQLSVPSELTFG
jgi:HAE1 family hydrophobic/amphiphilic exporter-1/multidrug efflux pump